MAKQNLNQLAKKIKASIPKIQVAMANSEVAGMQSVLGDITNRIFVKGIKTDGTDIGQYVGEGSKSGGAYKARRNKEGRRIDKVDLQFNGDLFNSITTGSWKGKPAVGINSKKQDEIAGYNEERYGIVFIASNEEKRIAAESARDFLFNELRNIIRTWS